MFSKDQQVLPGPCSIKALPGKGNADLLSPLSVETKKSCTFTPKQTFPNNKDFVCDFLKNLSPSFCSQKI